MEFIILYHSLQSDSPIRTLGPAAAAPWTSAQPHRVGPAARSAQPHARLSRMLGPAARSAQHHGRPRHMLGQAARYIILYNLYN